MGRQATILDDGSDPAGMAVPFDFEGIPKQRVILTDKGIAKGLVFDSHFAKLHHRESTGHAGPYDQFEGPVPSNLFFAAGDTPAREMLKKLGNGLWITRFHYVSGLLNTKVALMTGLTRDGTFLVRNGKVAGSVNNLRFIQPVLEAFSKITAASRERRMIADPSQGFSSAVVPALLIDDFTFTGQTR